MPRILIVGTAPYDRNCQSRAFDSYFHGMPPEDLAQIFTYQYRPQKGHCGKLFQITDEMMLKRFFLKNAIVGRSYSIEELQEDDGIASINKQANSQNNIKQKLVIQWLYKYGKKDRPTTYLLRGLLWKKNNWCTEELNIWLETFNPECVFLSFSDDFFISKIALYVAEKFNIPIISSIADDYYFNDKISLSPFYYLYRNMYKKLINKILRRKGSTAIYIGDRIRDKYNKEFGLQGETIYLTSMIERRAFRPIDVDKPIISYFGNIRLGRDQSLIDIGEALARINSTYVLHVYSNEKDIKYIKKMQRAKGIVFHGTIPYTEVLAKMKKSDILIVVEGFCKEDVKTVKYSISTKIPDTLSVGVQVFAYGDADCGAIDYLQKMGCVAVCTNKSQLINALKELIFNKDVQRSYYNKMIETVESNHRNSKSTEKFKNLIERTVL
jgi:hypothetical protein